jgi:sensor domain CHASE-containing protein
MIKALLIILLVILFAVCLLIAVIAIYDIQRIRYGALDPNVPEHRPFRTKRQKYFSDKN